MKKLSLMLSLIVVLAVVNYIIPNPVMIFYMNEFMFDSTGWKLELHPSGPGEELSLNGWFLTSKTDTAYFNDEIYLDGAHYTVITQDSLQKQLEIDPIYDTLTLYSDEGIFYMDRLYFGNASAYSAPTPKTGQSISLRIYSDGYWQQYFYYLDNTPTIGFENDTLNVKGNIDGYVTDSLNNPLEGVKVIYGYVEVPQNGFQPVYIETNSLGYFSYYDFSIFKTLRFEKEGYFSPDTSVQIWPDSTVTINIKMSLIVGITEIISPTVNNFTLTQNFPNPFNSSTTFIYFLPEEEQVEINVYDEKGELIQRLFKGYQNKGEYKVNWNADNLASGIYFYELKTKKQKISKKCLLLK
ncbi:MAG: hypothetical protein A2057_17705 [Ignavibacteria bacterium GWA2_35_9]|nr:MAG: hypothetical protein A2057_17705 [Ignavibacteria bacterium GWA2_35_9]OGU45940.1 MAG: hypothetical protein A2000_09110 [Ignavibacteria bacterium GWB2_36_8]OGU52526.1 MAG: hypothetical protein A2080_01760 [Ignavibacteria bacterium GWC2_36_12]